MTIAIAIAALLVQRHYRAVRAVRAAGGAAYAMHRGMSTNFARAARKAHVQQHAMELKKAGYAASRRSSFGIGVDGGVHVLTVNHEAEERREKRGIRLKKVEDFGSSLTRLTAKVFRFFGFESRGLYVCCSTFFLFFSWYRMTEYFTNLMLLYS